MQRIRRVLEESPLRISLPMPVPFVLPANCAITPGKDIMEEAKMIGITPAVLTFSGILVD